MLKCRNGLVVRATYLWRHVSFGAHPVRGRNVDGVIFDVMPNRQTKVADSTA